MAEKPILFNTEMVKAILEGRKTQTRRIVKPQESICNGYSCIGFILDTTSNKKEIGCFEFDHEKYLPIFLRPPYAVGDILWVRETWCQLMAMDANENFIEESERYYYHAGDCPDFDRYLKDDGSYSDFPIWRPSIHMPRKAARIFLKVTDVRVERLQDISGNDILEEGFPGTVEFLETWDKCYKEPFQFIDNPWVWVIEFEKQ